jgi:uracil-DNA glycosylase
MTKERALKRIAGEIACCRSCKKGCTGKAVPGEGSADAQIVFIGEAPGREEAKAGRPFVGRSGKLLRQTIREAGLAEDDVFITSPVHYLPDQGTPSKEMIRHGREHLFEQLAVIEPDIIVLLGNTACIALLDTKVEVTKQHGTTVRKDGRTYFITFHPAYAIRFTEGKRLFLKDFAKLKRLIKTGR